MDPQQQVQQATQQPVVPQPSQPVSQPAMPHSSSSDKLLWILLGIVLLVVVGGIGYYLGARNSAAPIYQTNSQMVVAKMPTATPTPDPTANWNTYSNIKYGYSVKYPTDLVAKEDNTYYHFVAFTATGAALPKFLISVIPETFVAKDVAAYNYMSSDWINLFYAMKVGGTNTAASGAVFTLLPSTTVNGQNALAVQVVATGYKQHRVYVKKGGYIYMISNSYTSDTELTDFQLFLSTFTFAQ